MHKIVLAQKQMILTSKRYAEHPFAGQNTHPTSPEISQQRGIESKGLGLTRLRSKNYL